MYGALAMLGAQIIERTTPRRGEWQPIDTAPRNQLIEVSDGVDENCYYAHWYRNAWMDTSRSFKIVGVTRWRPIAPPR